MISTGDLQPGDDSRRNFLRINENTKRLTGAEAELRRLTGDAERTRRPRLDSPLENFPFRVHTIPPTQRIDAEPNWWRIFYVQHGYVNVVQTEGCEDTDGEGTTPTEITVPDETPAYYIWAEVTLESGEVTAVVINHGEDGWDSFPTQPDLPDTYYALLAKIDTDTRSADKQAIVRQFQRQDIFLTPGSSDGGDPRWA